MRQNPSHPVSPPQAVRELAAKLESAGFETWCVGGAVRDALLGISHLDWDLATAATPDDVRRVFRRTVPVGERFGTVGVFGSDGILHEVTTFRRDVETDGRHAVVSFGVSLDEDLARRDFTINAIAYSPSRGGVHDPFGGREDLEKRVVRTVGFADHRMAEDRLRALRAIRFAARFGFRIEDDTWGAIERSAPHLTRLSAERVKQELEKTMEQIARPSEALELWQRSGALAVLAPPLASLTPRVLRTLDCLAHPGSPAKPHRRILRLAALFLELDIAAASATLRALRFSNADAAWIRSLLERFRAVAPDMADRLASPQQMDHSTIRRWASAIGRTRVTSVLRLSSAYWAAGEPAVPPAAVRRAYRALLHAAFHEPIELSDLAVDGDDLVRAGIPPGPDLGKILNRLLDAVLADPGLNTRDSLLSIAESSRV